MKKRRVLVICQHFWPETFRITDICEGFVENGFEVDVLCGIPNYPAGKFFDGYDLFKNRRQTYKGINIYRAPEIPRGDNSNFRIFINYMSFSIFSLIYSLRFLGRRYDRILVYQLSPVFMMWPGILLSKLRGVKLYVYICDFWPHSLLSIIQIKNSFVKRFITSLSYWHYRRADGVIAVFKGIQTRLISEVGINKGKTIYIAQAAEKIYEKQIHDKALEKRFKNRFNIVFAGNINPAQSFDTVLDAIEKVVNAGYHQLNLIIIGEGMSKKWLVEEVNSRGLKDYFTFEGFKPVDEVPKYQTLADALIVALSKSPLFEYGIPAKVQSYLASGTPIIGAMDGEGKRLINDSGAGLCVSSGDERGLAETIIKIIEMPLSKRRKMGESGRTYHFEHYERNYNLNRIIEFVFNDNPIPDKEYPDEQ